MSIANVLNEIPFRFRLVILFFAFGFIFIVTKAVMLVSYDNVKSADSFFLPVSLAEQSGHRKTNRPVINHWVNDKPLKREVLGYQWQALPDKAPSPQNNPTTPEKVALGKKLFNEKLLSANNQLSCKSCHGLSYDMAGTDKRATAEGIFGQIGSRNTPTVINSAFQSLLFWDGRAKSLEEQALGPITNPIEMGMPSIEEALHKLRASPEYQLYFSRAFPEEPTISKDNVAKALASYQRTLIETNTPYDRFVKGDASALSDKQIRGMALFEELGCVNCHSGPNFSSASVFSDAGGYRIFPVFNAEQVPQKHNLFADLGKLDGKHEAGENAKAIFRVPSLRNVSRTAPYFHNGSVATLAEAVRIMANAQLGKVLTNAESLDKSVRWIASSKTLVTMKNEALSEVEVEEIVAFLEALAEPETRSKI